MTHSDLGARAPAKTTALGAFVIWLPLFGLALWWAMTQHGTGLPLIIALLAAAAAAALPALVGALFVANHARLSTVFARAPGKVIAALLMALITPMAIMGLWPVAFIWGVLSFMFDGAPLGLALWLRLIGFFLALWLVWYVVAALFISGLRDKRLRIAAFALGFWGAYGLLLIA